MGEVMASGDWYRWNKKPTTDGFWQFKIGILKKYGLFDGALRRNGEWSWSRNGEVCSRIGYELNTLDEYSAWMRVHYTNTRTKEPYDYKIRLSFTQPNYGGKRWWLHCPVERCGRRVGVLYMGNVFGCRHCYNIAYSTQNESPPFRLLSRAQKIHKQLGGDGCVDDWIAKPKGMHHKTYEKKLAEMQQIYEISLSSFFGRFGWVE